MAAKKKKRAAKRTTKRKSAPRRAPKVARTVRRPKSTVRGQTDGELSKVFALSVRAGNRAAASRARGEMKRRSQFGEFDAGRFGVSADVLRDATNLLKARKKRP